MRNIVTINHAYVITVTTILHIHQHIEKVLWDIVLLKMGIFCVLNVLVVDQNTGITFRVTEKNMEILRNGKKM